MKVSQMEYKRVDIDEAIKFLDEKILLFNAATSGEEQLKLDKEIDDYFEDMQTSMSLAMIRFTQNTKDEFYAKEKDYYDEHTPALSVKLRELNKCYVESKFKDELLKVIPQNVFTNKKMEMEVVDASVVEELREENALATEYTKLHSGVKIRFEGKDYTHAEMVKFATNPDRDVRKKACVAEGKAMKKVAKQTDAIYDKMVKVRTTIAKKLGFSSFSEVARRRLCRNCYDAEDVAKFRENVKKYVVPLVAELKQKVAEQHGIKQMMLYDDKIYTAQEPKPIGTVEEIFANGKKMYHEMNEDTAKLFDLMTEAEAFDVLTRDGKWGGGYCSEIPKYKLPFILANFNGSLGDVDVLTHEFGHALAAYEAFKIDRPSARGSVTMETCECHSMSMEFFAYKWIDLFFGDKAEDYKFSHLAGCISFIPYGTIVDFFQQTAYDYYNGSPSDRNDFWATAETEFLPYMSEKGLPYYRTGRRWQQKAHIFESPFYYIDYCLAQMTAFQFLGLMQDDYDGAFKKYLQFVKIGGTMPYLDILKTVGLKSPFEEETFKEVTKTVRKLLKL